MTPTAEQLSRADECTRRLLGQPNRDRLVCQLAAMMGIERKRDEDTASFRQRVLRASYESTEQRPRR